MPLIRDVDHVHDADCGHGGNMMIMMMDDDADGCDDDKDDHAQDVIQYVI